MTTPNSRQSARELVDKIARDHGYLSPEKLKQLDALGPEFRREIEEAFLKKDLLIGSSVLTLAKNLYTSKARFVFELLQNADDNKYTRAVASSSVPYVSFSVYPDRIIVDCNEDGFTDENLTAICSVGKSSKTATRGYIGEKGIGFKSVFMVASKVHIQSGAFSFSFRHKTGESGMGMISPVWEDTSAQLQPPMTQLTLYLHDTGDANTLATIRESIRKQFEELQETFLLFMNNLKQVHVSFYNEVRQQTSITTYSIDRPRANYAILRRSKIANGTTSEDVKHFHVTTREAMDLAKNDNRIYLQAELTARAYSKSQVTLAFPLSEDSIPIIEPQDLFVFLPVRPVGFNFLIQADFVTDANRQDIVQDSPRNAGLLAGVADAFVKAILQFCEHDTLKFQWMKYLPDKNATGWRNPWLSLVNGIANRLSTTPVLYDRNGFSRRLIGDICLLRDDGFDENGDPLFHDNPKQIVSQLYRVDDLHLLKDYGLRYATSSEIFGWVENDIGRGDLSRIRSPKTSEDWHIRTARLLNKIFMKWRRLGHHVKLKRLELIPIQDGTWVSASQLVYFARVNKIAIPPDIHLRLVLESVTDSERLILFRNLGVKWADASLIRKEILELYPNQGAPPSIESSKRHLEFLYLTEAMTRDDDLPYENLTIHDNDGTVHEPFKEYIYIGNDELYGALELFRETDPGPNPGDGAPGHPALFVNEKYFEKLPISIKKKPWIDWFYNRLCVDKCVMFYDDNLEEVGRYLQKYRPEKFLGALLAFYTYTPTRDMSNLVDYVRGSKVLCRGNRHVLLTEAYFPTQELERRVERFVGQDVPFPWLWLDIETTPDAIPPEWKPFLTLLKVGSPSTDLSFALDMLKSSLDAFPAKVAPSDIEKLFELYDHIHDRYWDSGSRASAQENIRKVFSERKCIYIPRPGSGHTWAFPHDCVWDAPQVMVTKFALKRLYGTCFCKDHGECPHFVPFFCSTLGITECTWQIYVEELKALQASGCDNIDTITTIYKAIGSLQPETIDQEGIKNAFENDNLIYIPSDDGPAWHKISHCVWSKAAKLRGKVSLNDEYEDLEDLFVHFLGIKPVDLPMAIDELKATGDRIFASVSEVKESIWTVNSLLSFPDSTPPKPSTIAKSSIFHIRNPNGSVTRGNPSDEFFIIDRESLQQYFKAKVKLLDFTLDEVVRLRPFFEWMRLNNRCLSHCVKHITSFPGDGASPISNPNRQIRDRAYSLLRIAYHFNSPRARSKRNLESLYQILRTLQICEADGISSELQLSQDGVLHTVESSKTTLHINEDHSGLKIYIPRDEDDQEYMFTKFLPRRLFEWMMRHPTTQISENIPIDGVNALRDVLLAPRSRIAAALEDNGIVRVDVKDMDEDIPSPEPPTLARRVADSVSEIATTEHEDAEQEIVGTPISSVQSSPIRSQSAFASSRSGSHGLLRPTPTEEYRSTPPPPSPVPTLATPTRNTTHDPRYVAVLDKVITAARRRTLPSHGSFDMSQMYANLPNVGDSVDLGLRSSSQIERDCKVGAAGELYVFELLSHLFSGRLPSRFYRQNWKSNVRHYVTVHPEYADMEPWSGRETSDITYLDFDGFLTDMFIDKGYLSRDEWKGKYPEYFIEIKATTMSCDRPFYMSKAQYRRMGENVLTANNRTKIYVIFRVYNLGQDNMGLRVYFDPESLRLSGQLDFTAETWSVVPTNVN
ncbi:hypothetical protein F5Y04DRAFT_204258 [Hypomontagnella monticulosa]|nr:hypothetical protein F5Y04DRAFT_204258 [Hypomontagnella monticulosa]